MKKSKFLKKSLAMLLAVMLVVAMIPLSAAAAVGDYTPVGAISVAAGDGSKLNGEPGSNGNTFTVNFKYEDDSAPALKVITTGPDEVIRYAEENAYNYVANGANIPLTDDEDIEGVGNTFTFWVVKSNSDRDQISEPYTVNWTMGEASTEASIESAKLGDIEGYVDNENNTIEFTVPYGYAGSMALEIKTNDTASIDNKPSSFTGTVETNTTKGVGMTFVLRNEAQTTPETWTITVKAADALTAISVGDVAGEFEVNEDTGYETGLITFNMPAGTKLDDEGELNLVPSFTMGSAYSTIQLNGKDLKAGEEFNFADLLNVGTVEDALVITGPDGNEIKYDVKMTVDQTSTEITGFTVTDDKGFEATGTVNGSALSAVLSADAELSATTTKVVFNVPASSKVTVGNLSEETANSDGEAEVILTSGYTQPLSVKVVSADGSRQAFYTLTITKAESANKNPEITSAKLVINPNDKDKKAEYTAVISGTTITFTVPYSTKASDVAANAAKYVWAKTSQTKEPVLALAADPFDEDAVNTVTVTSDGGDTVKYTVVFEKEEAKTGKSISDFTLTSANNVNLVEYGTNYAVTASGDEFRLTIPQTVINTPANDTNDYYVTYTLSEGAKLYIITAKDGALTEVISKSNEETGYFEGTALTMAQLLGEDTQFVIADEFTACEIVSGTTTLAALETPKFENRYAVYTVEATGTNRTGTALTALSANDGLVTSTINGSKVTLNVPASYVGTLASNDAVTDGKAFFPEFTVSDGASLVVSYGTNTNVALTSGGVKEWDTQKKQVKNADATQTNPDFIVVKSGENYELRVNNGSDLYRKISAINVVAENGMSNPVTIEVKVNPAETGALLTSVRVGNTSATINNTTKTVTVNLPFGTNLGSQQLTIEASKLATVKVDGAEYTEPMTKSLTREVEIEVTAEADAPVNVYTLTATTAAQFTDVNTGDWFYQNVMDAVAAGIVSGRGDGTFGPNDRITRRDFAIMVSKLLLDGKDAPEATTTPFSDVAANDYGLNAIAYCAENGIISGFDGEFRPGDNITRQEAASVMKNALELTGTTSELFADDAAIATWAKANVYACKAAGVFNGDDHNNFNPTSTLTRAEAASIMVNAMK